MRTFSIALTVFAATALGLGSAARADLIGDWRFDHFGEVNAYGTTAYPIAEGVIPGDLTPIRDYSGNRQHGAMSGSARVTYDTPDGSAGIYNTTGVLAFLRGDVTATQGAGANFDYGTGPPNVPVWSPVGTSGTLEFLINFDGRNSDQDLIQWVGTSPAHAWVRSSYSDHGGSIRVHAGGFHHFVTDAVRDTDWHHLAVVIDRDTDQLRAYMDGMQLLTPGGDQFVDISGYATNAIGSTTSRVEIGRIGTNTRFRGTLDRMALSHAALGPGNFVIPEPSSLVLLGFAALALLLRRGRGKE